MMQVLRVSNAEMVCTWQRFTCLVVITFPQFNNNNNYYGSDPDLSMLFRFSKFNDPTKNLVDQKL